jgi:hypothetical protein
VGKLFVEEKARLYDFVSEGNPLESIALKAAATMEHLLLQRPPGQSRSKLHMEMLRRRLELWKSGGFEELLVEAKGYQKRMLKGRAAMDEEALGRTFAK